MIAFRKMNGLGNDFAVVDGRKAAVDLSSERIAALGNRQTGIGFDQFITLAPARGGEDALMVIHNSDGGEVESCGNAARCVAALLLEETGREEVHIGSAGGAMRAWRNGHGISVDMGVPRFDAASIPLADPAADAQALLLTDPVLRAFGPAACANVGNPHAVFWVDDVEAVDLLRVGPLAEVDPVFPEKANISFVEIADPARVRARVWERGAGATRACGTAACAIGAVGHFTGRLAATVEVTLPGGPLSIDVSSGRIVMTGDYALDWTGTITADGYSRDA